MVVTRVCNHPPRARGLLAKAFASWPRVRRAGDPDAYVRRIMLNANHSRFRKRRVPEQLTDRPPETRAEPAGHPDDRPALMAALMRLPAGQRAVVVLRYWMDMTETEAAAALGCSVGNVKSQAARRLLRHAGPLARQPGRQHHRRRVASESAAQTF
jgi:RNA polymerase sigma factor (sigma-70 family)